ncbi:GNAT family N-acetyltransferase [Lacticaseibacillus hulanensis]|uniref:GNAT family N-acetyltransferase n=1 Tax=Lacticaseibacillus hulanensis TaxID=2493111 RepID=UPI000FD9640F|nr:GNAT family N-acetyltransferase [Lacticaseibacillus hulanensis]
MDIRPLRDNDGPAFAQYRRDFLTNDQNNPYSAGIRQRLAGETDFAATLARTLANLTPDAEWRVPQIDYYLFDDAGAIVGVTSCRLGMNPQLADSGGHIGYAVAPSARGRGYAKLLLQYALNLFRRRGEPFVIVSAYSGNAASRHVIEQAGGQLHKRVIDVTGAELCIYHIDLAR